MIFSNTCLSRQALLANSRTQTYRPHRTNLRLVQAVANMSTWIPPIIPPAVEALWLPHGSVDTSIDPYVISCLEIALEKRREDIRATPATVPMGIPNVVFRPASGIQDEATRGGMDGQDDEDMDGEGGDEGEGDEFASDQFSGDGASLGGAQGMNFADESLRQDTGSMEDDSDADDSAADDDDGLMGYL